MSGGHQFGSGGKAVVTRFHALNGGFFAGGCFRLIQYKMITDIALQPEFNRRPHDGQRLQLFPDASQPTGIQQLIRQDHICQDAVIQWLAERVDDFHGFLSWNVPGKAFQRGQCHLFQQAHSTRRTKQLQKVQMQNIDAISDRLTGIDQQATDLSK